MKIEIVGPGCPRCHNTEEHVQKALLELNKKADVVKVSDIKDIIDKGILQTPALIINGRIIIQGKIPTVEQRKQFIQQEQVSG